MFGNSVSTSAILEYQPTDIKAVQRSCHSPGSLMNVPWRAAITEKFHLAMCGTMIWG
jgi:hypothetical protein